MTSTTMRNLLVGLFLLALLAINGYAQGNFVYVNRNSDVNSVTAFSVAAGGALTQIAGSPFLTGGTGNGTGFFAANRTAVCPIGSRLYVSNELSNNITGFDINASTGVLTTVPGSPFASGGVGFLTDMSLACTPDGHFLVATNSGFANNIMVFTIASNGALAPVAGIAALSGPDGIKISPNGRFIYVAEPDAGAIEAFSIASNGSLTPITGSPFSGLSMPTGIEINCAGTLLYCGQVVVRSVSTQVGVLVLPQTGRLRLLRAHHSLSPAATAHRCACSVQTETFCL